MMAENNDFIVALNDNAELDFFTGYNRDYYDDEVNDDPYFGTQCVSKFYDVLSLSSEEFIRMSPIFLSLNIQSLQSKYEQLRTEMCEFSSKNIQVEAIALQEVWDVRYTELFPLPGFKPLLCKKRRDMRGGGVGFYIKEHLNAEILEELSPFENKIIEALTIKLTYPDKKSILLTSVYRSNGPLHNVTASQQMERFLRKFSELLALIQSKRMEAYVFIDSNIDLLKLDQQNSSNYLNLIIEKSFLQAIAKATRCQNQSKTLIDHILFNLNSELVYSGTVISDISDHFFTFIAPPGHRKHSQHNHQAVVSRDYSLQNLNHFKRDLAITDWGAVLNSNDVNESYNMFWNSYKECHDANFPLTRKRFNKNFHIKQQFMSQGLLISRNTKNKLHKKATAEPTLGNIERYKTYKTLYFRTVRDAKKLYFTNKLKDNAANPKKTWDTLNEILGKVKKKRPLARLISTMSLSLSRSKLQMNLIPSSQQLAKKLQMKFKM